MGLMSKLLGGGRNTGDYVELSADDFDEAAVRARHRDEGPATAAGSATSNAELDD